MKIIYIVLILIVGIISIAMASDLARGVFVIYPDEKTYTTEFGNKIAVIQRAYNSWGVDILFYPDSSNFTKDRRDKKPEYSIHIYDITDFDELAEVSKQMRN